MTQPAVEMLWEDTDPLVALDERFGFTSSSQVVSWVRRLLSQHYGMSLERCQRIIMSDSNALAWVATDQGPFVVKWSVASTKFDRLAAISQLTAWLGERGHPVSVPVLSRGHDTQLVLDGVCLNVQHVMLGHHLDVTDDEQVHAAGAALARLHADLASHPEDSDVPDVPRPTHTIHALISSWLDADLPDLPEAAVEVLRTRMRELPADAMETQLVHGDFRAANILVHDGQVKAVLDFEELRFDSAVGELARSAVMLGTVFRDWGPAPPQAHGALLRGYESVRPLNEQERSWWPPLLLWWSLLMVLAPGDDPAGWRQASETLASSLNGTE